jgi:ABC transporter family protein
MVAIFTTVIDWKVLGWRNFWLAECVAGFAGLITFISENPNRRNFRSTRRCCRIWCPCELRSGATTARSVPVHRTSGGSVATSLQGLQTIPGSEGSTLSGGQRQRLALAQAFLKEAPILVLDEATANLDPETECDILDRVFQLTTDRTLIAITHRPEKLFAMDAVFTVRDGRLGSL